MALLGIIRRYLRFEVTEPAYADRQTVSAIDKYALQLSSWLKTEVDKNRKQRRSLKQLHSDLKELVGRITEWQSSLGNVSESN